jgi:AcrR family transcriptional regulator
MNDEAPLSKSERTHADIVKAAHDLIIQNGYHGTSMRQIASQAGIALGGIYNHFASKEEIFREVVLTYHPYHEIMPILASTAHDSLETLLRHAAQLIDETLTSRPDLLNLMFIEVVEIGMLLGYFMSKSVIGDNVPLEFRENALEHFMDIYLHGILKPETPS